MDEKKEILERYLPKGALKAITEEAVEAVPVGRIDKDLIIIREFPFKVGRESRVARLHGRLEAIERPKKDINSKPNNDLYLIDRGHLLNISREHFQIELHEDNRFYLVDRGSACGTRVGESVCGGEDKGGGTVLNDGDVIGVGTGNTPYLYRFISFLDYRICRR
jgi:hypothetical protein